MLGVFIHNVEVLVPSPGGAVRVQCIYASQSLGPSNIKDSQIMLVFFLSILTIDSMKKTYSLHEEDWKHRYGSMWMNQ